MSPSRSLPPSTVRRALTACTMALVLGATLAGPVAAQGVGEPVKPTEPGPDATTTTSPPEPTTTSRPGDTDDPPVQASPTSVSASDDDDGSAVAVVGAAVVGLLIGLLLAGVPLGLALSRRRRATTAVPPVAPPAPAHWTSPPTPPPSDTLAAGQRANLVRCLIDLRDRLPSDALRDEVARALSAAGIVEDSPAGAAFDPERHRAVAQTPTDDPARHNTVAAVERPGYRDGDTIVRPPEVVVARHGGLR